MDTFCPSNLHRASSEPGGAAAHAEVEKVKKYSHLDRLYQFQAVAVESGGTIGPLSKTFLRHLGIDVSECPQGSQNHTIS